MDSLHTTYNGKLIATPCLTDIATYMIDCLGYAPEDISDDSGAWNKNLWLDLTPDQQLECIKFIQED